MGIETYCGVIAVTLLISWWFAWIAACSVMIHYDKYPFAAEADLSYIYQVQNDWDTQPFVDMLVTTSRKCPTSHPVEVIYDFWEGSTILCDCIDRDGAAFRDIICSKGKNGAHNGDDCWV